MPQNEFKDFDHREPGHRAGAECLWARMRAHPGLPRSEAYGGFHVVTRYADVMQVALNHNTYSSASGISFPDMGLRTPLIPAEVDQPLHREYRSLLTRFLTQGRVRALEPTVRQLTTKLLDAFKDRTHVDFVEVFARPLPVYVSLELLGLPREDAPFLDEIVVTLHKERGSAKGAEAAQKLADYLERTISVHRQVAANVDESILSAVVLGEVDGRPLTLDEQASIIRLLLFGGFDTTTIALASAMWWLAQHPEDARRLRNTPELLESAIEEFVRFSSPASYLRRTVSEDTHLGGSDLCKGDRVLISFAAANRDPEKFENPDVVCLDRKPNPHLGFGAGIHRCIGSFVAKLELRVALEEILRRYQNFRLDPAGEIGWECGENQGINALPLIFERSS